MNQSLISTTPVDLSQINPWPFRLAMGISFLALGCCLASLQLSDQAQGAIGFVAYAVTSASCLLSSCL